MIRPFIEGDLEKVKSFHNDSYPFPDYSKPTYIIKKTLTYNDYVVGSAFVHLTCESGLILKKDLPNIVKARLIKELFEQLLKEITNTDLDDMHIFVIPESDTQYADFLIKHLGFKKDTSLVLYKGKDNEQSSTAANI